MDWSDETQHEFEMLLQELPVDFDLLVEIPNIAHKMKREVDEIEKKPLVIYSNLSVLDAIKIASDFVGESIPIVDGANNRLQGVITESDLLKAYLSIQKETQKIETE